MDIKVEDLKNYEEVSEKLLEKVKSKINEICDGYKEENYMEQDFKFEYDNNYITVKYLRETNWEDDGKYQYQNIDYQLVLYNSDRKIIKQYNLFFDLPCSRTGSYYSNYGYEYNEPTIRIANIKHIPEQIILAHDIVDMKEV